MYSNFYLSKLTFSYVGFEPAALRTKTPTPLYALCMKLYGKMPGHEYSILNIGYNVIMIRKGPYLTLN